MKEISFIDPITDEKHVLGYLDPRMIVGIANQGPRATAVFLQSGNNTFVLNLGAPMNLVKEAVDRAKSGTTLEDKNKAKPSTN